MSYGIDLDVKFEPLTPIDLDAEATAVEPRAPERTAIPMVEPASVTPTSDGC